MKVSGPDSVVPRLQGHFLSKVGHCNRRKIQFFRDYYRSLEEKLLDLGNPVNLLSRQYLVGHTLQSTSRIKVTKRESMCQIDTKQICPRINEKVWIR